MASIYAGLNNLTARNPDGSNNDGDDDPSNDVGQFGDHYLRITEAQYEANASDGPGGGPNGMVLPKAPTDDFSGFLDGLPDPSFFNLILDFEGRPAGGPPFNAPDILVGEMPQAREVSNAVMALEPDDQNHPSSFAVNELFDFYGQFLTHDLAEASTGNSGDLPMLIDGLPFPFGRTPGDVVGGVREQHNDETAFLDLSMVYGNNEARLDLARETLGGGTEGAKLLVGATGLLPTIAEVADDEGISSLDVLEIFTEPGFGGLPNPANSPNPATFENLYYAGDNRVNQQGPLISIQTVWALEHNYQVDQLTPLATAEDWTQDQLFEAARAINEAEFQNVVFSEYVPKLIGSQADALLDAYKADHDDLPLGIMNEWATVAFRFGHDQSSNDYTLLNADGSPYLASTSITLGAAFALAGAAADVPGAAHSPEDIDAWIRGLSAQFAQELDGFVADGNRNVLFGIPFTTVDLNAFDIQRGRDHGVWNYNELRLGLGLTVYASFDDYAAANGYEWDDARIVALKDVYGDDINKLDSIVGGLLEQRYEDSQLGETFTLINAIQFDLLKSDPFYFEKRLADNPELVAKIKGTTMAEIIARNSGADHLNLNTFQVANRMVFGNGNDVRFGADLANVLAADLMIGGGGADQLFGREGSDTLYGDAGNDWLNGGKGDDFARGGDGNDAIDAGVGDDNAAGDGGNDNITMGAGDDWASGGDGNDAMQGGGGADIMLGDAGNDTLGGGAGDDELFGGDGNDALNGNGGNDKAFGGAGGDVISGDAGDDELDGGDGNDLIQGGAGNDTLRGGAGNDNLSGGLGTDTLEGGDGNDQLDGGANNDTFVFKEGFGNDRITGFDANPAGGQDLIDLTDFGLFAADFGPAGRVVIQDVGADTLVTVDNASQTIRLVGVGNAATITVDDFLYT